MTPREVLLAAAALLEPEGRWTRRLFARAADGCGVSANDPDATCWCAAGAINRIAGSPHDPAAFAARGSLEASLFALKAVPMGGPIPFEPIAAWNDAPGRTQAEVVAMLRAAAQEAP